MVKGFRDIPLRAGVPWAATLPARAPGGLDRAHVVHLGPDVPEVDLSELGLMMVDVGPEGIQVQQAGDRPRA